MFTKKLSRLSRLDALIRRNAAGTPDQLARRLEISQRTVFRLIEILKDLGATIVFCTHRQSYCYDPESSFDFQNAIFQMMKNY